ncbi:hypothetical protein GGF42_000127 [Coemansia sp. RSA 2424]|nr:hypothetical protein GGF42_000127 [Coemansia sp. RSA 2424]
MSTTNSNNGGAETAPTASDQHQQESPAGALERRLGGQLDTLQGMLSSLAAKVEAIEEDAEHGHQPQQTQQGAVADAYKDMAQVEHAVGLLEPRLDELLSKLDSMLEDEEEREAPVAEAQN